MQLVAQARGALELEPLGCRVHLLAQRVDRTVVRPVEKGAHERDALVVVVGAAGGDARPETLLDLVPNAPGCARLELEQLLLIAEVHTAIESAVTQPESVVQLPDRLVHTKRPLERAVVDGRVVLTRAANDEQLRRRAARELDEREVTRIALHRDVEARPESLDESQFLEQRRELARRVVPLDAVRLAQDACALVFRVGATEVAQQPRANAL